VGIRPMVDLNSHYVILMNADASIAVVDPTVSMAGATSTLASLVLKSPGSDWVPVDRLRRLFISQPKAGAVAVVDTENFKVTEHLDVGKQPVRVALQPDGRFLWVGNNAGEEAASGVTVIDVDSAKVVGFIATGLGHHEIAFSADSRFAFVTNRQSGTLSVIDVGTRTLLKQIATGAQPLSVAYSALSQAVYVADGKEGHVSIIDAQRHEVTRKVALKPGLGPLRVAPNGRFVLALNPREDLVHVIDTASQESVHDIAVAGEPFQLGFTDSYAYVRAMHSERISMVNLASLGKGLQPAVQYLAIGSQPPAATGGVAIADTMTMGKGDGSVFIVNPADGNTYYYMEGMNAPSTNYRVFGSSPRAATVVDRSLKEVQPGVFSGRVRIPAAGKYDVAFMMQSPAILHCFNATAVANPALESQLPKLAVDFVTTQRDFKVGDLATVRFKLSDPRKNGAPAAGLKQVAVMSFLAPGRLRSESLATEVEPGVYEAKVKLAQAGGWYVHVGVPSLKLTYKDLGFYSLMASERPQAKAPAAPAVAR
jgi:YVTN family beta-propeller protein